MHRNRGCCSRLVLAIAPLVGACASTTPPRTSAHQLEPQQSASSIPSSSPIPAVSIQPQGLSPLVTDAVSGESPTSVSTPGAVPPQPLPRPPASCLAPVLSPDAASYLCRNDWDDVLQVPVGGGRLQALWRNDEYWRPLDGKPGAVAFEAGPPAQLRIPIRGPRSEEAGSITLPWPLQPLPGPQVLGAVEAVGEAQEAVAEEPPRSAGSDDKPPTERLRSCLAEHCPPSDIEPLLPLYDRRSRRLLVLSTGVQCCSNEEHTAVESLEVPWAIPQRGAEPRSVTRWPLVEKEPNGSPVLSEADRRRSEKGLLKALERHDYSPLLRPGHALEQGNEMVRWLNLGRGRELVMRQGRLTVLRNEVPLIDLESLPGFSAHPFCCGIAPDDSGHWPAGATCGLRAKIAEAALLPEGEALFLTLVANDGPDGCERGPRYYVLPLPH